MPKETIKMKPQMTESKIESIHVGRVWTKITIRVATNRLAFQSAKAIKKALSAR